MYHQSALQQRVWGLVRAAVTVKLKRQIWLLLIGVLSLFSLADIAAGQAPRSVQNIPLPVLNFFENISEWRMAGGFIYLSDTCTDFSTQTTAYIQRRAINGQTLSTLEDINGTPQCRTFRHAAVDESGIYYYNRNLGRLEAIYSDTPTDPPTALATIGDWTRIGFGNGISALRLDGSYVYWIETIINGEFTPDDVAIKRVSKSGGTPDTLISYSTAAQTSFDGLGVTSTHIWWTDSDGLNRIDSCTFIACLPGPVVKTVEFSISSGQGHIQVSGSNVFWWNGDDNPEQIRRTRCSIFSGNCSTTTVHTAGSGSTIVGLAANSEAAFWVEDVPLVGRRLRRQLLSSSTAETLLDNVHYAAPYLDVGGVYFQTDINTISRLPFDAVALTREIGIIGWEVTQGIQRATNDVPLVAGKTTYVRLYPTLEDGLDVGAVTAALHGSRNGAALPGSPIYPLNSTIPINAGLTPADRGDLGSGWLFRLPESWTRSGDGLIPQADTTTSLRAVIDPNGVYADTDNPGNNEISADFFFTAKAPTCMTMRPVVTNNTYQPVYGINVGQVVELTESVLPTPKLITFPKNDPLREIDWCWKGPIYGPFCSTPYELSDDDSLLLTKMGWIDYWADSPAICFTNNARTLFAGIVHNDAIWDWGGLARIGKDQFLTKVPEYGDPISRFSGRAMTMVHEIGHNYNRRHIDCGGPLKPDLNYPYPTDMLDFNLALDNLNLHFGFDPLFRTPIIATATADFMTYCGPEWYSDYTWKALFNNTRDPIFDPFMATTRAAGGLVRVAGVIDGKNNQGLLDYAWTLPAEAAGTSQRQKWAAELTPAWDSRSAAAGYHLQLIDPSGQVLADQVIEMTAVEDGHPDSPQPFALTLTAPTGTVARLQLMMDNTILATLTPGSAPPTITIDQPTGGANVGTEITVGWAAADPDQDQLLYTIQYAPNDEEWYPLLINYGGTGAANETITLDLSDEAGSDGARVRVLASDGYNTTIATSQPFSVTKRGPFVAITNPAVEQTFMAEETIPLQGLATDPEDGLIADDQFVWSTGQRGQTAELRGMAPGPHTLELTATDSGGLDGTSSISFTVAPLAVPETAGALVLDGRCDDAGYQNAPQLPLTPYSDGARAGAHIIHTSTKLWLCLSGLQDLGGYAGLLVDADNSGEASVQSGDFGYFVQPDGTRFVNEGNGSGFDQAAAGTLSARIYDNGSIWSAELSISKSALGSWQKRLSLAIGHFAPTGQPATVWPGSAAMTSPQSWGETNFGLPATLAAVTPASALLNTDSFSITISGVNFVSDHVVLWNGIALSTTLVNTSTLTAVVSPSLVTAAGRYDISVGLAGLAGLTTAASPFTVNNPQPSIVSLTPNTATMGQAGQPVTVNGIDFISGATVMWNGEPYTTTFISPTQLDINITAAELASARPVPLAVINPEPSLGPSQPTVFIVSSGFSELFLPLIRR